MIHDEICTYEVAQLAKEKGFNIPTDRYYHIYDDVIEAQNSLEMTGDGCAGFYNSLNQCRCAAPTQSLLQRWLREEKEVFVEVHTRPHFATTHTKTFYVWNIQYCDCKQAYGMLQDPQDTFCSYEEALEDALKYALENLV